MAAKAPDAQTQEVTNLRARSGLRALYLHFTGIDDGDTFDLGLPISHTAWEADTALDMGALSISGSVATMNSGGAINGAMVLWTQDRKA